MTPEITILVVSSILFVLFGTMYFFGDKIRAAIVKKKAKKEPKKEQQAEQGTESKEEKLKTHNKVQRPVLLSPVPLQEKKEEKTSTERDIKKSEIEEIKRFISSRADFLEDDEDSTMDKYEGVENFGDVIDLDDLPDTSYQSSISNYQPYSGGLNREKGESQFLKNRDSKDSKLYEELKNMSPEMKRIIMADILKRKS